MTRACRFGRFSPKTGRVKPDPQLALGGGLSSPEVRIEHQTLQSTVLKQPDTVGQSEKYALQVLGVWNTTFHPTVTIYDGQGIARVLATPRLSTGQHCRRVNMHITRKKIIQHEVRPYNIVQHVVA